MLVTLKLWAFATFLCSHWPISQSVLLNLLLSPLKTMPQFGLSARVYQHSNTVEKKVLCHTIQRSAQEQASMAKTCEQVVAGKSSLLVLHLSSWGCNAWDKTQEVFPVMGSLHLFLNLFCKANNMFKQSLRLLYPQGLGLCLALVQLCRVEKSCSSLTAFLECSFRENRCQRPILGFAYVAFLCSFVTPPALAKL